MKRHKVVKWLGSQPIPESQAIEITLFASPEPRFPWAVEAEGIGHIGATPHDALRGLLRSLAKKRRAEKQGS